MLVCGLFGESGVDLGTAGLQTLGEDEPGQEDGGDEGHQDPAPVLGVALAGHVAGAFEAVDEAGRGAGGEPGQLGDPSGGRGPFLQAEEVQALHVGRVQPEVIGDGLAQRESAGGVGVRGGAIIERRFRRLQNMGRGREIWIAAAEGDDVGPPVRKL